MLINTIYYTRQSSISGNSYNFQSKDLGSTVTWNHIEWIIVNIESNIYTLALKTMERKMYFGTNNIYKGSDLENSCIEYEQHTAVDSLALAISTDVHNTTHKIYIPEATCFSAGALPGSASALDHPDHTEPGTYQYYTSNYYRKWDADYWTASNWNAETRDGGSAWTIIGDGYVANDNFGGKNIRYEELGFRPHVRVKL